jgi:hypothetical protein
MNLLDKLLVYQQRRQKLAVANTALNFEHVSLVACILSVIFALFDPGQASSPAHIFVPG